MLKDFLSYLIIGFVMLIIGFYIKLNYFNNFDKFIYKNNYNVIYITKNKVCEELLFNDKEIYYIGTDFKNICQKKNMFFENNNLICILQKDICKNLLENKSFSLKCIPEKFFCN